MQDVAMMSKLYTQGRSLREIGEALGCSYELVRLYLRGARTPVRSRSEAQYLRNATAEKTSEICSLYLAGREITDIMAKVGCCSKTVYAALNRRHITRRPQRPLMRIEHQPEQKRFKAENIAALYRSGISSYDIAQLLHISRARVYSAMHSVGVFTRAGKSVCDCRKIGSLYYDKQWSLGRCAMHLGLSLTQVRQGIYRYRELQRTAGKALTAR